MVRAQASETCGDKGFVDNIMVDDTVESTAAPTSLPRAEEECGTLQYHSHRLHGLEQFSI